MPDPSYWILRLKIQKSIERKILYSHTFVTKIRTIILQHTHIIRSQFGVCTKHQDRQWSVSQPLAQNKPLSVGSSLSSLFPDLCGKWYFTRVGEGKVQFRGDSLKLSASSLIRIIHRYTVFGAWLNNAAVNPQRVLKEQHKSAAHTIYAITWIDVALNSNLPNCTCNYGPKFDMF